ncbi:MAG: hypothetical protein JKY89_09015 [Immundisolibacteraceae bacterium]|nr:hypothetical protein [Immundisolibacteraceae bacterium]
MASEVTEAEYRQLANFLYAEADMLSEQQYPQWLTTLAEDLHYLIPVPKFVDEEGSRQIGIGNPYFDEDIVSMRLRLGLLSSSTTTTAENPRSLMTHIVSNIRVEAEGEGEYICRSCITIHRTRYTNKEPTAIAGRREDLIRRTDEGFQLVKRHVKLSQAIIMSPSLSFFF